MCKAYANIFVCVCYGEYFMKKIMVNLNVTCNITKKISHKNLFFLTFQKFVGIYQNREGYTKDHMEEEVLYGNNNVMLCKVIKNNTAVLK